MDASMVRMVMAMIPERVARLQTGSVFSATDSGARHAERIARLGRLLHWMSPLETLPREEQQALGLLNAAGRPVHAADLEDEADMEPEPGAQLEPDTVPEAAAKLEAPLEEDALA